MTRSLVCSVATHNAIRVDLEVWLDLPIRALEYIEAFETDPAYVQIHKQCEAPGCGGAIGKLVELTGELAEVWATLQREQSKPSGGVSLVCICKSALDGDELALRQYRAAMELERAMSGTVMP